MADEVEPERPQIAGPPSLLGVILTFVMGIKTWSRAGIAVLLGFSLLGGYLLYQNTQQVFEIMSAALRPAPPEELPYMSPLFSDVQREVENLRDANQQDLIGIAAFKVNILTNQETLVAAVAVPAWEAVLKSIVDDDWKYPRQAFRDDPVVNHLLVRLYLGRFVCLPPHDNWKTIRRLNARELCFIAVPPDGIGLAGFIGGAWDTELSPGRREQIEASFRAASEMIVWHRRQRIGGLDEPGLARADEVRQEDLGSTTGTGADSPATPLPPPGRTAIAPGGPPPP